ncbi:MAG TPA: MBL fold metallo-hydrolase [Prosthecobacter sp.]|nr:MBL fold metallo-hydrolase [Prosthecobacter sp.]
MPSPSESGHSICITCGVQFAASAAAPSHCPVCEDERQYVAPGGQCWTTLAEMRANGFRNVIQQLEPGLWSITTEPRFAIGQRALLVRTPNGNLLWDCIPFLDEETVHAVQDLGGIRAIAISHPHYYSTMVEWSRAFGNAPIHLHQADRAWIMRPDPSIQLWLGETHAVGAGLTLIHTGGHFDGFQVLHWSEGAEGRGVLLSGDQPQIVADPRWVSFMYSYPNFIPLNASAVRHIVQALDPHPFDRIYSAFTPGIVATEAKSVVRRSADRYLNSIAE